MSFFDEIKTEIQTEQNQKAPEAVEEQASPAQGEGHVRTRRHQCQHKAVAGEIADQKRREIPAQAEPDQAEIKGDAEPARPAQHTVAREQQKNEHGRRQRDKGAAEQHASIGQ